MKKIIMAVASIAMAVSMFAADFAATINILGNAAAQDAGGSIRILETDDTNFKDGKDLFGVNYSGDKAGASIGIGTDTTVKTGAVDQSWFGLNPWDSLPSINPGGTHGDLNIRSVKIWMTPIENLKITWGDLYDEKLYCEHISWWRTPESKGSMNGFTGINLDLTAGALRISASVATGWGGSFIKTNDFTCQDYSVIVKYTLDGFDVGAAFHDTGKGAGKIVNVGASFGNEWGGAFFGFVNVYLMSDAGFAFNEFALDNWFKFKTDAITASVRVPVALKFDMSDILMDWEVKVEYPVDAFNLYGRLGSNGAVWKDNPTVSWGAPYNLASGKFVFNMGARIGAGFNVGSCAMDACFALGLNNAGGVDWKIPVGAKVSF